MSFSYRDHYSPKIYKCLTNNRSELVMLKINTKLYRFLILVINFFKCKFKVSLRELQ